MSERDKRQGSRGASSAKRMVPTGLDAALAGIAMRLRKAYPRIKRRGHVEEVPAAEALHYTSSGATRVFAICDPPAKDLIEVRRHRVQERGSVNALLWYRVLRRTYGTADVAVLVEAPSQGAILPVEWSYCLRVHKGAAVEIRSASHSIHLVAWRAKGLADDADKEAAAASLRFTEDLQSSVRRAVDSFDYARERERAYSAALPNPHFEKYSSALELIRLGATADKPEKHTRLNYGERSRYPITGSVHLAAIVFLYTSLEAFEQLVRDYLLRPQFRTDVALYHVRSLTLQQRVARMHEFCEGFERSPRTRSIDEKLRRLNRVRNQVLHGNTPDEMTILAIEEDGFFFTYQAEMDDENKAQSDRYVPYFRGLVRAKHARYVKSVVDEVIGSIVASLQPAYRLIGEGFRSKEMLVRQRDGRVAPMELG